MRRFVSITVAAMLVAGMLATSARASVPQSRWVGFGGYASIQDAVDDSAPGDAIVIAPGVHQEAVVVETPNLTIRGFDRNATVLDGGYTLSNGFLVRADGVEISNLTVGRYKSNGIFFTGSAGHTLDGYLAHHVTAYNNGLYGVYAFEARKGAMRDSYASGNADSGFYIGGCYPCDATIERVTSDYNGLGYSGTNAGGNLYIQDSLFRHNRAGILPNTLNSEPYAPQRAGIFTRNTVEDSGDPQAPSTTLVSAATGFGIGVSGGNFNLITDNSVTRSSRYGIVVFPYPDTYGNFYQSDGNEIVGNTVSVSGWADLALAAGSGERNCFSGNAAATSDPLEIQTLYACSYDNVLLNVPVSGSPRAAAELVATFVAYEVAGDAFACSADREQDPGCRAPGPQPSLGDPWQGLP